MAASAAAWLLALSLTAAAAAAGEGEGEAAARRRLQLLQRKCCPRGQQLSAQLDACEPLDEAEGARAGSAGEVDEEAVSALLERFPSGFPPWMSNDTPLYDQAGERRAPLLAGQPAGAVVRFGPGPPCERERAKYFVSGSVKRYRLLRNGTLLLRTDAQQEPALALGPDDYCADRVHAEPRPHFVFIACPCRRTVCVSKCCNRLQHQAVQASRTRVSFTCVEPEHRLPKWTPRFEALQPGGPPLEDVDHIVLDSNPPTCPLGTVHVLLNLHGGERPKTVRVLANGSALLEGYGRGAAFAPDRWCGDWAELSGGARVENAVFCQATAGAAGGGAAADADAPAGRSQLYGALFAVSAFFLLLTLVVYLLLPQLRRSANAKALLCHVAALMVGSLALASGQLRAVVADDECFLMGFIIQYMMLATFFWLNVLCFDIATAVKWGEQRVAARSRHIFLWYSLYAWGVPALITAVTVALQFLDDLPDTIVLPDIGVSSCWFHTAAAGWAYFYGPLAVLLGANALLAAAAAAQLLRGRRTRSLLRSAGVACALFVLSGVSWLCEVASFADGSDSLVWTVMDVVNILRGLFVFVLLCCRPKVGRLLRRRLCGGATVGEVGEGSSGAATSVYSALQMETVPSASEVLQHPTPNGTATPHA